MPNVFITGANRGLGLEFARQYSKDNWDVIATCRKPDLAENLIALQKEFQNVSIDQLDVTNPLHLKRISSSFKNQKCLDLLICNAVCVPKRVYRLQDDIDLQHWAEMFEVNVQGPFSVIKSLLYYLRSSPNPKVAIISSVKASIERNYLGGSYEYRSTKSALNSVCKSLAIDLRKDGVVVAALSPGWVPTGRVTSIENQDFSHRLKRARQFVDELGGLDARQSATQSVYAMREVISEITMANSGQFLDHKGRLIPW